MVSAGGGPRCNSMVCLLSGIKTSIAYGVPDNSAFGPEYSELIGGIGMTVSVAAMGVTAEVV